MRKNILITGVGGDIGQSIIKCLKAVNRHTWLIGCDIDKYAAGQVMVHKFYIAPPVKNKDAYCRFIEKIIGKENIDYIFPSTEAEIEFFNDSRPRWDKKAKIFINSQNVLDCFLDKYKTIRFLQDNKVLCPKTYLLKNYKKGLVFPCIIKQRKGSGGKGFKIIRNREELAFYKKTMQDAVVQELAGTPEEEYTVGVFSDRRNTYCIAFKRVLGYDNLSKVAVLVEDKKIEELARKIADSIFLKGAINIQMRKTQKGYIPFEINPRLSSTVYVRHLFGFEDVRWWMNSVEGKMSRYRLKQKTGCVTRVLNEVFLKDLEKGKF